MYCVSCSKSNVLSSSQTNSPKDSGADIISYQIEGMNSNVSIDFPNVNLLFGDSITNGKVSVASFVLSPGAHASINEITQVSGITQNNFEYAMVYTIASASGVTKDWEVEATNNNYTVNWSLGQFLIKSVSNNRSYEWYIDQGNTGTYSDVNC